MSISQIGYIPVTEIRVSAKDENVPPRQCEYVVEISRVEKEVDGERRIIFFQLTTTEALSMAEQLKHCAVKLAGRSTG